MTEYPAFLGSVVGGAGERVNLGFAASDSLLVILLEPQLQFGNLKFRRKAQSEGCRGITAIWELEIFSAEGQSGGDRATTTILELEIVSAEGPVRG